MTMLKPIGLIKKKLPEMLNLTLGAIYFACMLPFYYIRYFVPDHGLYYDWGISNLPSENGYSSLFIDIFRIYGNHPLRLHMLSLVLITASILLINAAILRLLKTQGQIIKLIIVCGTFVWGQWYYFCGKLVWSYPFALISFAIAFYLLMRIIDFDFPLCKNEEVRENHSTNWAYYLVFALLEPVQSLNV